jgi:hypothetical protein
MESMGITTDNKETFLHLAKRNAILNQLIRGSINNVKKVDKIIEDDLVQPYSFWIPVSKNLYDYNN